jgi:hypothetical protein
MVAIFESVRARYLAATAVAAAVRRAVISIQYCQGTPIPGVTEHNDTLDRRKTRPLPIFGEIRIDLCGKIAAGQRQDSCFDMKSSLGGMNARHDRSMGSSLSIKAKRAFYGINAVSETQEVPHITAGQHQRPGNHRAPAFSGGIANNPSRSGHIHSRFILIDRSLRSALRPSALSLYASHIML